MRHYKLEDSKIDADWKVTIRLQDFTRRYTFHLLWFQLIYFKSHIPCSPINADVLPIKVYGRNTIDFVAFTSGWDSVSKGSTRGLPQFSEDDHG